MSKSSLTTSINIVAGFLGSGKTSTINYILSQRPPDETWAIIINEYGRLGIDQHLINSHDGGEKVIVKELTGGCICCSAQMILRQTIVELLRRHRPHRLLIEPTGLASLKQIRNVLADPGLATAITIEPMIALVTPAQWCEPRIRQHPVFNDQIEHADLLLASQSDIASSQQNQRLMQEAPPHLRGRCAHGIFDLNLLWPSQTPPSVHAETPANPLALSATSKDSTANGSLFDPLSTPTTASIQPDRHQHLDAPTTRSWQWDAEQHFDADKISALLGKLWGKTPTWRRKGWIHTNQGWQRYNITTHQVQIDDAPPQGNSRLEAIESLTEDEWTAVETLLNDCLIA